MAQATVIDARSGDSTKLDLSGIRFETEPKEHVIHRAVVQELESKRRWTASTKGRNEVRGSGAKLWRQKGTGRARVGDAQSPTRYGGGIWGGPKPKHARFGKRINRKEALSAFNGALSAKAADGEVFVLDSLAFDAPSTKAARELVGKMNLSGGRILLVLTVDDKNAELSFRNLPEVAVVTRRDQYGVYELLRAHEVVFSRAAYEKLVTEPGGEK